jgi:short-subunit dehydrogenase
MDREVAVITGASSGIGRLTARRLAVKGMNVVLAGRNQEALDAAAEECRTKAVEALTVVTDVAEETEVAKLAQTVVERFGRIDVWVNNAGVTSVGAFTDTTPEAFRRIVDVNFFGIVHGTRAALDQFTRQGWGTVINISSVFGIVPSPYESAYVASKFAVTGFSASVRQELELAGLKRVHVCTVLPSAIDTPIYHNAANSMGKELRPLPPIYPPQLVARTIVHLARHPRAQAIVGGSGRFIVLLYMLLPAAIFERLFARYSASTHFGGRGAAASSGNIFNPSARTNVAGDWPANLSIRRFRMVLGAAAGMAALLLLLSKKKKKHATKAKGAVEDRG